MFDFIFQGPPPAGAASGVASGVDVINGNVLFTQPGAPGWLPAGVQLTTATIASAQVLALRATPAAMIAAPGPNKVIVPILAMWRLRYAGTPYTVNTGVLNAGHGTTNTFGVGSTPYEGRFLTATADSFYQQGFYFGQEKALAAVSNQPLTLMNTGAAEFLNGNSSILVKVAYYIMDVS